MRRALDECGLSRAGAGRGGWGARGEGPETGGGRGVLARAAASVLLGMGGGGLTGCVAERNELERAGVRVMYAESMRDPIVMRFPPVAVDLIAVRGAAELAAWEAYPPERYFAGGDAQRRAAEREGRVVRVRLNRDTKMAWIGPGIEGWDVLTQSPVTHVVVMANLARDEARETDGGASREAEDPSEVAATARSTDETRRAHTDTPTRASGDGVMGADAAPGVAVSEQPTGDAAEGARDAGAREGQSQADAPERGEEAGTPAAPERDGERSGTGEKVGEVERRRAVVEVMKVRSRGVVVEVVRGGVRVLAAREAVNIGAMTPRDVKEEPANEASVRKSERAAAGPAQTVETQKDGAGEAEKRKQAEE